MWTRLTLRPTAGGVFKPMIFTCHLLPVEPFLVFDSTFTPRLKILKTPTQRIHVICSVVLDRSTIVFPCENQMSSDSNNHGVQCGPGPPYTQQQVMSSYMATDGSWMPRSHGSAPTLSPPVTDISSSHQGIPSAEERAGGRPIAQPAFRMGGPPASSGLVRASLQGVCGAGISTSARAPIATSGYYPYPSPVASLYPYALMSHSAGPAPAVGGLSTGGLDQELIGTLNRTMALLRSPTPASPSTSMESAWGAQYPYVTGVTGGSWPGVSMQAARRDPCFPTSPPAVVSSAVTVRGDVSSVAAGGMPAPTPSASASVTPAILTSTERATPSAAQNTTQPRLRAALTSTAVSSSGREQQLSAPNGASSASTTSQTCAGGKETGKLYLRQRNTAGPEERRGESRDGEDSEDEDDTMKGKGVFEADGTEKRRRLTAEERLQRSRERNQLHARKTRQRKKAQLQLLVNRSADLQAEQQRLRQAITDRRTASILLCMSGSDDVQGVDRQSGNCKASRDHPPALAEMSGRTPRAGMLSALESDDTGDGGGKGTGGNRSDDLGSETTAGTSSSASSSGRTSSEANSSDGVSGGSADGGDGVGAASDKLPTIGNPGDTERLLELSHKTRSECTPEELEQIRRERNRMHAKRTRDRKKLHLEATEGTIARLEQENRKLRDSMKAMGSIGSASGGVVATSSTSSSSWASLKPEAVVPTGYPLAPPPPVPQAGSSLVHSVSPPPSQPPAATSQQPYPGHHHPFLHHPAQHGPHMPQQHQLHGGGVAQHVYPQQHQHHLPHGTHQLVQQSLQQTQAAQQSPVGFYPYRYSLAVDARGSAGGIGGGHIVSDTNGGGSRNGASPLVKPGMNSYTPGGRMSSMGFMGTSNPHFPTPQVLAYQGSTAFSPTLGKTTSQMMVASPHAQHHVYRVPEPQGYKGWDVPGHAQTAHLPYSTYAHAHAHAHGRERSVIGSFPGRWDPDAAGVGLGAGAISAAEVLSVGTPGAASATVAAQRGSTASQLSSSNRSGQSQGTPSNGAKTDAKIEGRWESNVVNHRSSWGTSAVTSGKDSSRDKSKSSSACGGGSTSSNKSDKRSPLSSKSSSSSAAGNGPARLFARAREDQIAQAEKAAAGRGPAALQLPQIQTEQGERSRDESSTQQAAASNDQSNKLDRDLSRGCQEAWQQIRRERSAKRKRAAAAAAEEGPLRYYRRHRTCSVGADTSQSSCNSGAYSGSDCSHGDGGAGSSGEGSIGEGSVSSNSSSSSWGESEESSVLPASTTSSERGRGRHEGSGSYGRSPRDGSSQSGSESSREELGLEKAGAEEGKRITEMTTIKVARR